MTDEVSMLVAGLDEEIEGLLREIPWFEQNREKVDAAAWPGYCAKFTSKLREALSIVREQRFDLITYGKLKERY